MQKGLLFFSAHKRYAVWGGLILLLAGALYACLDSHYRTGIFNDDAFYVLTARDLVSSDRPPSLLERRPDFPLPGLPLVLAPLIKAVAPHWTELEKLSVVATLLAVFFLLRLTRNWMSEGESLTVAALFAFNPVVTKFSGIIMPEPYYTAATLACFWLMGDLRKAPTDAKALGLGFLLGWASVLRPEGVLLALGIIGTLLVRFRDGRRLTVMALAMASWIFVLRIWMVARASPHWEYAGDIAALGTYWQHSFGAGIHFIWPMLWLFGVHAIAPFYVAPTPGHHAAVVVASLLFMAALTAGFRSLWKERPAQRDELTAVAVFSGLYLAVHVFWHVAEARYALTVLPFVLVFLVRGLRVTAGRLWGTPRGMHVALALLFLYYGVRGGNALRETYWSPNVMNAPPWRSLAWLRQHTPTHAKTLSPIAATVELYAQRPSMPEVNAQTSEGYLYALLHWGLDYVVDRPKRLVAPGVGKADNPNQRWRLFRYWMVLHPEHFQPVYRNAAERSMILRVVYDPRFGAAYEGFLQALQSYNAGQWDRAFRQVRDCLAFYPELGTAINLEGVLYLKRGDDAQAERDFLHAEAVLPGSPVPLINLATLYEMSGQPERAALFIQRAKTVCAARGEEAGFSRNLKELEPLWSQGRGIVFVHPA